MLMSNTKAISQFIKRGSIKGGAVIMYNKLLTISIAAYNVERFIKQTLESLLITDGLLNKLEVFVIDDGGTDETLRIAKDYEKRFPNVFHAVHKEDEGYGSTFNYSIERATGKYFKLLDGDDWFSKDNLQELVLQLEKIEADIIVDDFYKCKNENKYTLVKAHNKKNGVLLFTKDFVSEIPVGMWALIYKTSLLRECKLKLPENMFYVDMIYSTVPFACSRNIMFIHMPLYCYRLGRNGQSVSRESRIKYSGQILKCCNMLLEFCEAKRKEKNKNYNYILNRVTRYYQYAFRTILLKDINKLNKKELIDFEKNARFRCLDVYNESAKIGKAGILISVFRKSKYAFYWTFKIHKMPNWK